MPTSCTENCSLSASLFVVISLFSKPPLFSRPWCTGDDPICTVMVDAVSVLDAGLGKWPSLSTPAVCSSLTAWGLSLVPSPGALPLLWPAKAGGVTVEVVGCGTYKLALGSHSSKLLFQPMKWTLYCFVPSLDNLICVTYTHTAWKRKAFENIPYYTNIDSI